MRKTTTCNRLALIQQRFYLRMGHLEKFITEHPYIMGVTVTGSILAILVLMAVLGLPFIVILGIGVLALLGGTIGLVSCLEYLGGRHDAGWHASLLRERQRAHIRRQHPALVHTPDSLIDTLYDIR